MAASLCQTTPQSNKGYQRGQELLQTGSQKRTCGILIEDRGRCRLSDSSCLETGRTGSWCRSRFHRRRWARSRAGYRRLTYDNFGNLSLQGTVQRRAGDSTAQVSSPLLNVSGRALIDTANSRLRVVDGEGDFPFDEAVLDALSPDQFRHYEFFDDQLKLTVQDENGRITSTTIWRSSP